MLYKVRKHDLEHTFVLLDTKRTNTCIYQSTKSIHRHPCHELNILIPVPIVMNTVAWKGNLAWLQGNYAVMLGWLNGREAILLLEWRGKPENWNYLLNSIHNFQHT